MQHYLALYCRNFYAEKQRSNKGLLYGAMVSLCSVLMVAVMVVRVILLVVVAYFYQAL